MTRPAPYSLAAALARIRAKADAVMAAQPAGSQRYRRAAEIATAHDGLPPSSSAKTPPARHGGRCGSAST
jgi:hypothetical protein